MTFGGARGDVLAGQVARAAYDRFSRQKSTRRRVKTRRLDLSGQREDLDYFRHTATRFVVPSTGWKL